MSGNSLLIDTNIALYLLNGDSTIAELLDGRTVYVSFVSELEPLGFQDLNVEDRLPIVEMLSNCVIVDLNQSIKEITIDLKQNFRLKLPDAIIAATAKYMNLPLLSADKVFERIADLQFIRYEI